MESVTNRISHLIDRLFRFQDEPTRGELLQFRLVELLIISQIIYFSWSWGWYIQKIDQILYPTGLAAYIDISFLLHNSYSLVNALIITLLCVAAFFRWYKYGYLWGILLIHMQYAARFSLGKLGHGSVMPGLMLLIMALTIVIFKKPGTQAKATRGLMIFFIGIVYESAALCKLVGTGIDWPNGYHLWLWISERLIDQFSQTGSFTVTELQKIVLQNWFFATAFLSAGLLTEMTGFALWSKKIRPVISTALIVMHIGVMLLMAINFNSYIWILLGVCYPWYLLFDRLDNYSRFVSQRIES